MKTIVLSLALCLLLTVSIISCQKNSSSSPAQNGLSKDEKSLIVSAGFNGNWAERTTDGNYLIEGDILLTKAQLQEMTGQSSAYELIMPSEEHYRTTNIVSTPASGQRIITV